MTRVRGSVWNPEDNDYTLTGGVERTLQDRLGDAVSVKDFGAVGDGVTDDSAAIQAMEAALGYVQFSPGDYFVDSSFSIDVPVYYTPNSFTTINTGQTLTFTSSVSGPREYLFQFNGTGVYSFTGERSRNIHVSWFGAFVDVNPGDAGPFLQAATDAMGNSREAEIHFDVGTYWLDTGVVWNRASRLIGVGERLTNFFVSFLTGDVFSTNGTGCRFERLQFNVTGGPRTSGAFIALNHNRCTAEKIQVDAGFVGVALNEFECEARDIKGLSWSTAPGSRIVSVAGEDCVADDINYTQTTPTGPEYIVAAEALTQGISRPRINNIQARTDQHVVGVLPSALGTVDAVQISNVRARSGDTAVYVLNASANGMNSCTISDVIAEAGMVNGVVLETSSTGGIFGVAMTNIVVEEASGFGIHINRAGSGSINNVSIGTHDLRSNVGILVGGAGGKPAQVAIGAGLCRNCATDGYDILGDFISMEGIIARTNTGVGVALRSGGVGILVNGISSGNGTDLTDSLGTGVSKDVSLLGVTSQVKTDVVSTLTIASGVVTKTGSFHQIDTEGAASSDTLTTINGGNFGDVLIIKSTNDVRDVTVADASGNIQLAGTFTLSHTRDRLTLHYDGSNWIELSRSDVNP